MSDIYTLACGHTIHDLVEVGGGKHVCKKCRDIGIGRVGAFLAEFFPAAASPKRYCEVCAGTGHEETYSDGSDSYIEFERCVMCNGTGIEPTARAEGRAEKADA